MPQAASPRKIKTEQKNGQLTDLSIIKDGKSLSMLGAAGLKREYAFLPGQVAAKYLPDSPPDSDFHPGRQLPVLLGGGLGYALEALAEYLEQESGPNFQLAVVDKERDILEASGLLKRFAHRPNITWINESNPKAALNSLSKWQMDNGNLPFYCIPNPFYLRLDRPYYDEIRKLAESSAKANFWEKADYPKFKEASPRILLITSGYFLIGDLEAACRRMGLEHQLLNLPDGELAASSFIERLLGTVVSFRPDFILTINHLGVDREGILQDLLARLKLPLASWFVDNPHLILYRYTNVISPWTAIFTWDADNIQSLRSLGFEHVNYMPLGTDHERFRPLLGEEKQLYAGQGWQSRVSFVGNSMLHKVTGRLNNANPSPALRAAYPQIAAEFSNSDERSVRAFMEKHFPELMDDFAALGTVERQLSYETLITWEATLRYRLSCVKATLPFEPLIVGDDGWFSLLDGGLPWRRHKELSYYTELPYFYPFSDVNFNCTSKQMKGAVNQRVFDVPATGSFLVTDWREQIENLFEPGKEVICYHSPEEAQELIAYYLKHPSERASVIQAARKRVLAEHRYESRLEKLIATMRKIYG